MNEQQYVESLLVKIDELNFSLLNQQRANIKLTKDNRSLKKAVHQYKESNEKFRYHNRKRESEYDFYS